MATAQGHLESPDAPASPDASPPAARRSGRARRWVLRLAMLLLAPALFLVILEFSLRIAGYGYATDFFVPIPGGDTWTTSEKFAWRFTLPAGAPEPEPFILTRRKAPGVVRIFVMGGSAALGVPDPAFGFSRVLEVMLREQYPNTKFEVFNAAMMGINSHAVLPIARQCADFEPDICIIYLGNNEACGFFGPTTRAPGQDLLGLSTIRASLWARSTRIGQLLSSRFSAASPASDAQDLKAFLAGQVRTDEPRYRSVADRFRGNLDDILNATTSAGARVVLCTVAVNLRDCPPFGSLHRPGMRDVDQASFEAQFSQAQAAQKLGHTAEAAKALQAAARIDDSYAELHFRLAGYLLTLGRYDEAREEYSRARDLDSLQFRTDSRLNGVIRDVASAHAKQGVALVDVEHAFATDPAVPHGIVGHEYFYEHAHLRFAGNVALAKVVLPAVQAALPESIRRGRASEVPSPTVQHFAELLALAPLNELRMAEPMAALNFKPPFLNQFDNAKRRAQAAKEVEQLRQRVQASDPKASVALYTAALARSPDDWRLHHNFADLLLTLGRTAEAQQQLQTVLKEVPRDRWADYFLGQVLIQQGKAAEAVAHYQKLLQQKPGFYRAVEGLGDALAADGKYDQALAQYRRAQDVNPGDAHLSELIVKVLVAQGKMDAAADEVRRALADEPELMHSTLARLLRTQGKIDEAVAESRLAIAAAPDDLQLHIDLGAMLLSTGRKEQAVDAYRAALRLRPDSQAAISGLGAALCAAGQVEEGTSLLQRALAMGPDFTAAIMLGNFAAGRRDLPAAEQFYRKAIAINPRDPHAQYNLGATLVGQRKFDEAIPYLQAAADADANYALPHEMLAQALDRKGQTAQAIVHYRRSLELNHRPPQVLAGLAWHLATSPDAAVRNGAEAVKLADEAAKKTLYGNWHMLDVLAAADAESGNFDRAAHMATVAARMAASEGRSRDAAAIRARAALYEKKQPYRTSQP